MKREKISEQINFIGCWNIENENLCDSIVKFFERSPLDPFLAGITAKIFIILNEK